MLVIILLGVISLLKIPVTLIPELNPPIGVVVTSYPGASPEEVNEKVTKPLEQTLATLPGIERVQSTSQEGANLIILEFSWSTNIQDVQLDVLQRIDLAQLPDDAGKPSFLKFDPAQFPVVQLALSTENDNVDIRVIAEELEQELRRTEGVASVNMSGKVVEEIAIQLDAKKLKEQGLTQTEVVQTIQANNVSMPGEPVETQEGQLLTTRTLSTLTSAEDIANLILSVNPLDGEELTVGDVATVKQQEQASTTETFANNKPAILMSVLQESGANTAQVSEQFKAKLDELLQEDAYQDVKAEVLFDQGDYINRAISNIGQSMIVGGIFAMLVLFVFLRGIKSPIIIGVAIPYSVIVTFVLMYFANFSLNIMTLGALALGIGMLVDNAIVVIENIERHLGMGETPIEAAKKGTRELATAISASTLTTIAVFVPVLFIEGLIGQIFTEFALTISFSLFASLVVSLTVVPMLASRMLKTKTTNIMVTRNNSAFYTRYKKVMAKALQHRALILISTGILFVASCYVLLTRGTEFLPATDEGFASVSIQLPNGASTTRTKEVVEVVESHVKKEKDVDVYVSLIGATQESTARGQGASNRGEMYIKMKPKGERDRTIFEFAENMEKAIQKEVAEDVTVQFNISTSSGSAPQQTTFRLTDTNTGRLQESANTLKKALEKVKGVTEVTHDLENTIEEIQIEVDRERAQAFGFAPAQVAQTVNQMTRGQVTTQLLTEDDKVLVAYTGFGETYAQNMEALQTMELRSPSGTFVKLEDIADVSIQEGPVSIRRSDQASAVAFFVKYSGEESLGSISKKVDEVIAQTDLPKETTVAFSGDRELYDNSINDMIMALFVAVLLVYFVMAAQFESFKYPFIIMFTVPLMVIGVAIAFLLTNTLISVTAVIGILVLVGIVVNNGIVFVDYINQKKAQGMASYDAIMMTTVDRLRPVIMTATTTILGLIPLALGIGEGTEMNQPMGIAVIGGLVTSTLFTLFIVPIIYSLFDKETRKKARAK